MPGAPNRPPEAAAAPVPPPVVAEPPAVKLLRRLVPSHVALLQEIWKGGVPPEVLAPYERAETAYRAGEFASATTALDQLSIRFTEPRWPTLPEPYRRLRVAIPAPVPPSWDPDHGLPAPEKEARAARRRADDQLALADGCVRWATAHLPGGPALGGELEAARAALAGAGDLVAFYRAIDGLWNALDPALAAPNRAAKAPAVAAASDEA